MKKKTVFAFLTGMFVFNLVPEAQAGRVDLTGETMYVHEGFSTEWLKSLPDKGAPGWLEVAPGEDGKRAVIVKNLKFDGAVKRSFLSLKRYPDKTYTFVTKFNISGDSLKEGPIQGVYLSWIAGNWEIFINGHLVKSEMHLNPDGSIKLWREMLGANSPLDPRILRDGENILALRIVGDPTFKHTGLYRSSPYFIDDYEKILEYKSESLSLVFVALYLFFGLYHIFLFINRRSERYNFYFGMFAVMLAVYLFTRTHAVYSLINDTGIIYRVELISLFMLIPLVGVFSELIIERSLSIVTKIYSAFCLLLILPIPFTPLPFCYDVLRIWQSTAIIPILYYLIFTVVYSFILAVMGKRNIVPSGSDRMSLMTAIGKALGSTVVGNIFIGLIVLIATTLFDIMDAVFFTLGLVLTRYGFFVFVAGITLVLANRFLFLHREVEDLNIDLGKKVVELDTAKDLISLSEEKYRLLVEGTNEGVFSLADDWSFITANRAFMKQVGLQTRDMGTIKLFDLVHEDPEETNVVIPMLKRRLDEFVSNRKPFEMKLKLKSAFAAEPREYTIRLEHITIEGKNEILGRAALATEDALIDCFVSERQSYIIGNYLGAADDISHRLVRNVVKYFDPKEINLLRIGIREMIINAIEHGNLNISFDEKSNETMSGNYMEFLAARQQEPEHREKKVHIEFSLTPERAMYKITDMGEGFDHAVAIKKVQDKASSEMLAHGRGITMAMNLFDAVMYNKKGNQVLLIKKFAS